MRIDAANEKKRLVRNPIMGAIRLLEDDNRDLIIFQLSRHRQKSHNQISLP